MASCFSEQVSRGEEAFFFMLVLSRGKHWGSEVELTRNKILVPDGMGVGIRFCPSDKGSEQK